MLRRVNAWVSVAIIVLFLIHGIAGGYQMAGILAGGNQVLTVLAWLLVALVCVHVAIGTVLTVRSVRASKSGRKAYAGENAAFIVRRVSGFCILVFLVAHVVVFYGDYSSGAYRLNLFAGPELWLSLGLVISLAVHLLCNIRPLFIGLGLDQRARRRDLVIILAVILAFCAAMFVLYYYRWNVGWQWNISLGS